MANKRKIGVIIDSLKLGTKAGIKKAKELGADGFQIYCTGGDMAPEAMNKDDRQAFKRFVASLGLEISALCGDLFKGFLNKDTNPQVVKRMKEFVDLAVDLDVKIVTSHIGTLVDDENHPSWATGIEALSELGRYAADRGVTIGMETGPEEPIVLKKFLDKIATRGIGVNYDPANLVMCGPYDHIGGVAILKDYIVHTHAKDGICLHGARSGGKQEWLELPLGKGGVVFPYYLKALDSIGYQGYLTIEREVGDDPVQDISEAIKFLRSL